MSSSSTPNTNNNLTLNTVVGKYQELRSRGLTRNDIKAQYPRMIILMKMKYAKDNFPSPGGRTGGTIPTTRRRPSTRRKFGSVKPKVLFQTRSIGTSPMKFPKSPVKFPKKETPLPAPPANSVTTRYKQLKEKLKAIQNIATNRARRSENNARELRQLIRQRDSYMQRFSSIRGTPTSYYNRNFHRFYRLPPVHKGLAQYYYYQQPGVPRYVQQLPGRVWRLNQGGRGLPPVPFYPTRRQARRVPRRVR